MASKKDVCDELDFATDKISTQIRTVSLGVLALAWGLLIGESEAARAIADRSKSLLLGIGAAAILTLLLDYFQYIAAYVDSKNLLDRMERENRAEGSYDYRSKAFRLRKFLYISKQVTAVSTAVVLLIALAVAIFR